MMQSNRDQSKSMNDQAFVQGVLRDVYTIERFGSVKAAQFAAWKFLRGQVRRELTLRRVRHFFEGTARIVRGEEKDAVRAAQLEEARNERIALRARLERLDDLLTRMDEEFHGPALEAYRTLTRETG